MSPARRLVRSRPTLVVGVLSVTLLSSAGCSGRDAPADGPSPTVSAPGASVTPSRTPSVTAPAGDAEGDTGTPDPSSTTVPQSASGEAVPVSVPGQDTPGEGRVVRYTVEVERGLEDVAAGFPEAVRSTLTDPRGWQTQDHVRFVNVSPQERARGAETDIRIQLASPALVDKVCAPLRTNGRLSCHSHGRVMLNAWRWINGATTYGDDLAAYRVYLVNHEVGHSIGHGHVPCPSTGDLAPIMLQQTLRLEGCRPNPYPVREPR